MTDPLRGALVAALGAQYDVLRLIGKGGMGAVYLGQERLLERAVAIKVLPQESASFSDARDRFMREARIAARLTHPNIVPLFSFGAEALSVGDRAAHQLTSLPDTPTTPLPRG
jgi:serine/threonine protein kinase